MTKNKFRQIIANVLEIDPEILTGDKLLADIESYDSVAILSLMVAVNEESGVAIDHNDLQKFHRYGDIVAVVQEKGLVFAD
jgi:acyl carrier protein